MRKVYFDNGSTSFPKAPGVGRAMMDYIETGSYNIGRGAYESSYALSEQIMDAREKLREFFGSRNENNLIFTPNVTFSLNYLIHGLLKPGDHLLISSMEHNAVARPAESARMKGVVIDVARCDEKGVLNLDDFEKKLTPDTKAVVMLHGSNVSGAVMPVEQVGKICKERGVFFILDTAQTAGVFPVSMNDMNIDGLAFTGHKGLLGPQGIGGLLLSRELGKALTPIIQGGTGSKSDSIRMPDFLPDKLEPGTMNLPGIIGLSASIDYINKIGIDIIREKELKLTRVFMDAFAGHPKARIVGPVRSEPGQKRCPIVSLDFPGMDNADIAFRLDSEYGIMTRVGLHCAPMAHQTLGTFPHGTIRFSFGHFNTEEEVTYAIDAINKIARF